MLRHHHSQLLAGLAVAAMAAAGCGSDSEPAAKITSERPATVDLESLLIRNGEQPGFRRVDRAGTDSFDEFVKSVTPAEARQLRRAGFISITFQRIEGPRDAAGISNVQLFKTAKGAQDTLAHELRTDVIRSRLPGAKIRRFTVPGIPGARGWTSPAPGHPVANVHWVQGRCLLVLGNQGPGPFVGPLSTGARAIYERTKGQCPSGSSDDLAARVDESTLAATASAKGLEVEQHDDPQRFAVANTLVYNVERLADADAANKEAREQLGAAFEACPTEGCRRAIVTCIPGATGAVLVRDVRGDRRYEYVVVFTKGGVVGQVWASSVKKDLENSVTAAAQELYDSIRSVRT